MINIKQKIEELRNELRELEKAYYSGNATESDDVYDFKLRTLVALENEYPELKSESSPTNKVGFYRSEELNVPHEIPMLSLNNAFGKSDLDLFFNNCEKEKKDLEYVLEPKIDGASISLIYENGYLTRALSRGDGEIGEDLTPKILHIPSIPIYLNKLPKRVVIRGEIYIRKSDFELVKSQDNKDFANHRNFVAGSLRLKKSSELSKKRLRLKAYQVLYTDDLGIYKQSDVISQIKNWGIESHEEIFISKDKEKIYEYIESFGQRKSSEDIPYDGLVVKVNDLNLLEDIGYTSKFPKWATAYKYPSLVKESKLLEIIPTVGRTGKITYSARIEPIEIDGSTVQYATLHNANYIMDLDLRIGDYVSIYKSGEIVPKIIGFSRTKRQFDFPKWEPLNKCPSCNSDLVVYDNLSTQFCLNKDCTEKKYAKLTHWSSRSASNIEGLSTSIIVKLSKLGILNDIDDIYRIKDHKDLILSQDLKIKDKLFQKLIDSIEKSKDKEFRHLLFGLGINYVGEEVANLISKKIPTIDHLMQSTEEELLNINGIGKKSAEAIYSWINKDKNKVLIEKLKNLGLFKAPSHNPEEVKDSFLQGKKIVVTGKLSIPRNTFSNLLEAKYGAYICKDISSTTDYLIVGEDAGSKIEKAKEKNIPIITEEELIEKLKIKSWE